LANNLGVSDLDQFTFKRLPSFIFLIVSSASPTELFEVLLAKAYCNDRNDGHVAFFRDSRSRISELKIVILAHEISQK